MLASSAKSTARSLRNVEQQVVSDELNCFESTHLHVAAASAKVRSASRGAASDSTASTPTYAAPAAAMNVTTPSATAAAGAASSATLRGRRTEATQRLMQTPFAGAAVHGERSALAEAQQVHAAVAWLGECPSSTLRALQQRVLCATELLFTQLVGMPAAARELLALSADPNDTSASAAGGGVQDLEAADRAVTAYVTPPSSLTFTEFLSTFLRDAVVSSSPAAFHGVLISGRPQPAAPLSSLHLVYGLHVVEDVLRPSASISTGTATDALGAVNTGLEAHQALLSEVVHWAQFFEHIFDPAREGLCRDPINFYAAVLLACAERGALEQRNTPDAVAEEAVRRLQLSDSTSGRRPDICGACQAEATYLAESCRTYVRRTLRSMQRGNTPGESTATTARSGRRRPGQQQRSTRFFLATPAVVWWAAAFLRLYRLRTPVAAATETIAPAPGKASRSGFAHTTNANTSSAPSVAPSSDDVVSSAEVYFIRDWIARAAKMDEAGFAAQEKAGGFVIPLSCATGASVAVFRFTQENVQTALRHITAWADAGVATSAPLQVQELLTFLQDDFSTVPYYMSFFATD